MRNSGFPAGRERAGAEYVDSFYSYASQRPFIDLVSKGLRRTGQAILKRKFEWRMGKTDGK